ncbi:sulfate ABC transporter permease subunit CysT [Verrucomicrobium sp. GAS474]|uniref:sulfate ABC transporter permease subunit CysT n=1 Tax=Verrucomicrobium sp. GAS474 TaxID=1882831 RepID=UPI000B890F49
MRKHILPGFGISLGYTVFGLSLIVLFPIAALFHRSLVPPQEAVEAGQSALQFFWATITEPEVVDSFRVSLQSSALAALVNGAVGFVIAWVLSRYDFPGRRLFDSLVDLPFALPTAVAGLALTQLYSANGWIGSLLAPYGIRVAFTQTGITLALIFIGLPFVVRTVQPVIQSLHADVEEAAACLGANRWQTFRRVILPALVPAWITGITLAFGRAVGEYGSIVFIAANIPFKTEIAPILIIHKLEQYNYAGAAAIGATMVLFSVVILATVTLLQRWHARHTSGHGGDES